MVTTWTPIAKASGTSWTKVTNTSAYISAGQPIGLLLTLTYAIRLNSTAWTKVSKAAGTAWTKIAKAT